jgi:hypothetical protein
MECPAMVEGAMLVDLLTVVADQDDEVLVEGRRSGTAKGTA